MKRSSLRTRLYVMLMSVLALSVTSIGVVVCFISYRNVMELSVQTCNQIVDKTTDELEVLFDNMHAMPVVIGRDARVQQALRLPAEEGEQGRRGFALAVDEDHVAAQAAEVGCQIPEVAPLLPPEVRREDAVHNIQCAALMVGAMACGDLQLFATAFDDRLHQEQRYRLIKGAKRVLRSARAAGALAAGLSGAGPTLIAFTDGDGVAIRQAMRRAWFACGVHPKVQILEQDNQGAQGC